MARRTVHVPLRWSDMDAYGHVNNVEFVRLYEEARVIAFHERVLAGEPDILATGVVVARHEVLYLHPLRHRVEPVIVRLWVSAVGGASFDMQYELLDSTEPGATTYSQAQTTIVRFNLETQRPQRLTPDEVAWIESMRDEPLNLRRERGQRRR